MRALFLSLLLLSTSAVAEINGVIDVHRDANCGCCKEWIKHLKANGFTVKDHVEPDMVAVKQRLSVPPRLASCHTAVINGQFVEGHVPAADIIKLQRDNNLLGAAVPGMPIGSPGMEMGDQQDAFEVIGLTRDGRDQVLNQYPAH